MLRNGPEDWNRKFPQKSLTSSYPYRNVLKNREVAYSIATVPPIVIFIFGMRVFVRGIESVAVRYDSGGLRDFPGTTTLHEPPGDAQASDMRETGSDFPSRWRMK